MDSVNSLKAQSSWGYLFSLFCRGQKPLKKGQGAEGADPRAKAAAGQGASACLGGDSAARLRAAAHGSGPSRGQVAGGRRARSATTPCAP